MATLGGKGVAVGAGDGVGCAAIGGIAADGGVGAEGKPDGGVYGTWVGGAGVATLVAKGVGWGAGTGWEQASRARQIAAQRAAVLGVYPFCICLNKSAAGAAMAARLGNAGITPYLNIRVARGRLYLSWLGALNFWRGARGARGARQNSGRGGLGVGGLFGGFGIEAQYWAFARQHVYVAVGVRAKGGYVARRVR